jgi:hypothetical protein
MSKAKGLPQFVAGDDRIFLIAQAIQRYLDIREVLDVGLKGLLDVEGPWPFRLIRDVVNLSRQCIR